jgi:hypothetical protein
MRSKAEVPPHAQSPRRRVLTEAQKAAWDRTKERARNGCLPDAGKLDRDALHDRDAMRREFEPDNE